MSQLTNRHHHSTQYILSHRRHR